MKQKLLNSFKLRVCLLVAILCAGFTAAWADTAVYTFNTDAGLTALGISKPATSAGTNLGTTPYVVDGVSMSATDGSTATRVWNSSGTTDLRIYKSGGSLTFTAPDNNNITSIVLAGSTVGNFSANVGSFSAGTWTGSSASVILTATNTGKINTITVTYSSGGTPTPTTYTVTFNAGAGTFVGSNDFPSTNNSKEAGTYTLPSATRDGYTFDGWKAGNNDPITGSYTVSAAVDFTAQYTENAPVGNYEWVLTDLADLTTDDIFVIVGTSSGTSYSMSNNNGTGTPPAASAVTIDNNKITSTVSDNIKWLISGNATDGYVFYPNGNTSTWLYCTATNNGVRVGTNANKTFKPDDSGYLVNTATSRYLSYYSEQWRCYNNTNNTPLVVSFYKRVDANAQQTPSITASNVNIAFGATSGSIAYTINNAPTPAGTLTAAVVSGGTITNLAIGTINSSTVSFTCSANEANTARSATVTLTYTYGNNETVTKNVTITQAAAPVIYSTIPALFNAATSTETAVNVTFNNWVVSGVSTNGKNVFVTDNSGNGFVIYFTDDMSSTFAAGNILAGTAVSCNLVLYNGFAELTGLDANDLTITTGGTVSTSNIALANLAGVNTGAVVSYQNLTCSVTSGKYYLSDGTTTLQVYNSLFAFDALVDGKKYNITGVYQQFNNTKEILPRSAADIVEVQDPYIDLAETEVTVAATVDNGTIGITYDNLPITDMTDFDIQYCDAQGNAGTQPSWVDEILVAEENGSYEVSYVLYENTSSDARTVYFKVYAMDDATNLVYSDLVSITQAGVVNLGEAIALVGITPSGVAYALSCDVSGSNKLSGVEVDVVNGKVVNGQNDKISWYVASSDGKSTFMNKDNNYYLAKGSGNTDLTTLENSYEWTEGNDSWSITTGSTVRSFIYNTQYSYFGCYATSNAGTSNENGEYTEMPEAYTFADGYTRTVNGGNWGTICLPKAVAASDFSGVTFYTITGKKMNNGSLEYITASPVTSLQAGYAYLFKADDQATKLIAAYTGDAVNAPVAVETSGTGLQGAYVKTEIPVGGYILKGGVLYYVDKCDDTYKVYAGANKAYIDLTNVPEINSSNEVKGICLFGENFDEDAIKGIEANTENGVIYNLAGQRLSKPVKGINIINGRKVVVK